MPASPRPGARRPALAFGAWAGRLALLLVLALAAGTPARGQGSILDRAQNEPAPQGQTAPSAGAPRVREIPNTTCRMGEDGVLAPTGRRVSDCAGLLSESERERLERQLYALEDSTGTQIVVVLLNDIGGDEPAQVATRIGYSWKVGQAGQDNGAVLLVVKDTRQMFIAVGKGLEGSVPDAIASRIVRNVLAPNFREGNFYDGLSQAVDMIAFASRGEFTAPEGGVQAGSGDDGSGLVCLAIVVIFVLVMILASRNRGGGRGGRRYRSHYGGPPVIVWGGGGGGWGGGGGGGIDFGGFSGGGGDFGGGGAGGDW